MKIGLVENGVFPIRKDAQGNKIETIPDTGYLTSGTVQGEGKLLGTSCLFIRLSGCNLKCAWRGLDGNGSPCDTPYSSWHPEQNIVTVDEVIAIVKHNIGNMKHVVVSGGEPTIQPMALIELLKKLTQLGLHTTIETNATVFDSDIATYTNLISMSPKLSTSVPHESHLKNTPIKYNKRVADRHDRERLKLDVIQSYIDSCYFTTLDSAGETIVDYSYRLPSQSCDFQLKFVASSRGDIEEIKYEYLDKLKGVYPSDVVLMPEGIDGNFNENVHFIIKACLENGWRFTPRLHAMLFGVKKGV